VRKITTDAVVTSLAGSPSEFGSADGVGAAARFWDTVWGMAVDPAGNIYATDPRNQTIRKITREGSVTTIAGVVEARGETNGIGAAARFWDPHSIAVSPAGQFYVTDFMNSTIRVGDTPLTTTGAVSRKLRRR
jgi:DNA-binding beta-propeller fold protein YncE